MAASIYDKELKTSWHHISGCMQNGCFCNLVECAAADDMEV